MMFAAISDRYGFTPDVIAELTLDQAEAYLHYLSEHPPTRLF